MSTKYLEKMNIEDDAVLDELLKEAFSSKKEAELPPISERKTAMKKNNRKWIAAAAAAAVCLLIPAGVYASSKATMYVSHSSPLEDVTSFEKKDETMKRAGVDLNAVETFANGYTFDSINVHETQKLDEDGNAVGSFMEWNAYYSDPAGNKIFVNVHRTQEEEADSEKYPTEVRDITRSNGEIVTVYYEVDQYKFVPPDYEKTAEDIENEAGTNYYISYGSSEIEERTFTHVNWEMDGQSMSIMGFDTPMSADEMFDMAAQMID